MTHPVITKLNEAIKIADSYYKTLCSNPHPSKESQEEIKKHLPSPGVESYSKWLEPGEDWKTAEFDKGDVLIGHLSPLPDKQTKRKWDSQASNLNAKFEKAYNAFKPALNLPYSANDFSWWLILTDENGLLYRVRLVLDGFKEIRDRLEILPPLEEKAIEPPWREGKPAYRWEFDPERQEVKCNGSKPVKLEPRLFGLFEYLHGKKQATLKRIRKDLEIEERYNHLIANRVSKLISALDKEAKVLGLKKGEIRRIVERERDGKKLVKVIFHAS